METLPTGNVVDRTHPHPCLKCSYELGGLPFDSKCPECGKPVAESLPAVLLQGQSRSGMVDQAHVRPCFKCAYDLRGLHMDGKCPECGTPVAESLRGILLHFADKEYIAQITSGVSLILNSILLMVIVMVVGAGGAAAAAAAGFPFGGIPLLVGFLMFGISIISCVGYFKFASPDPGFTGTEYPDTARKIIRFVVVFQIGITVVQFVLNFLPTPAIAGSFEGVAGLVLVVSILMNLASIVAWAVQIISMMNYLHWLAKRIPDANIESRSKRYRWLLPVIYVVGIFIIIGPLIALVMYWNLLDRLRKHLKSIQQTGIPAVLKGTHLV